MKQKLGLFLYVWIVGNLFGIIYTLMRITRRVEIKGHSWKKLNHKDRGLLVICNHPSPTEGALLPFLFYPLALVHFRPTLVPRGLPAGEFYHKRWFIPFRPVSIPIDRDSLREGLRCSKEVERRLREGQVVLIHPERERIYTEGDSDSRVSRSGKKMKMFRPGARRLFLNTNCLVLPVWMDGGERMIRNKSDSPRPRFTHVPRIWRKVTIKIGEPMDVGHMSKDEVVRFLEDALLELADREM